MKEIVFIFGTACVVLGARILIGMILISIRERRNRNKPFIELLHQDPKFVARMRKLDREGK